MNRPVASPLERDLSVAEAIGAVADELRSAERFLLTTHENPDGDALGSLLAMQEILSQLGKDSVMYLAAKEFPLPVEYRFLPLEEVFHEPPADVVDRVHVFLDCGNIDRTPKGFLRDPEVRTVNIDHHHDNTRFGSLDLVDTGASSTAEIVFELAKLLGAELTPEIASALYVGLVTDTGRFSYDNTDETTHRMAAELIEAGVDVSDTARRLYEHVPIEKVRLVARALGKIECSEDGRLALTYISADDYAQTGASELLTEGIIDHVRALEGTAVAALVRDRGQGSGSARKVSLRSSDGEIDVSAIARSHGGGGHRRAAGFSTDLTYEEIVSSLRAELDRS
ncbi:MAG: bifunctional oligoribonuclease/PAP phosphatase NrnA [bacterium]